MLKKKPEIKYAVIPRFDRYWRPALCGRDPGQLKNLLVFLVILFISVFCLSGRALADEAPVYDADNFPPQFSGESDSGDSVSDTNEAVANRRSEKNTVPVTDAVPPHSSLDSTLSDQRSGRLSLSDNQRISKLEGQITALQQNDNDNSAKLAGLQAELQTLRGQIEQLTHQLQATETQLMALYRDLDHRLATLQGGKLPNLTTPPAAAKHSGVPLTTPPSSSSATEGHKKSAGDSSSPAPALAVQPNVAEEQQTYQAAYDLIRAEKYPEAVQVLQKMLHKYPAGQFAANAHYWLGELYGLQGKNNQSANEFRTVITHYPDSPRIADATLKLGLIDAAAQRFAAAKKTFKKVTETWPGTASARLASEQLKQLRQMGH